MTSTKLVRFASGRPSIVGEHEDERACSSSSRTRNENCEGRLAIKWYTRDDLNRIALDVAETIRILADDDENDDATTDAIALDEEQHDVRGLEHLLTDERRLHRRCAIRQVIQAVLEVQDEQVSSPCDETKENIAAASSRQTEQSRREATRRGNEDATAALDFLCNFQETFPLQDEDKEREQRQELSRRAHEEGADAQQVTSPASIQKLLGSSWSAVTPAATWMTSRISSGIASYRSGGTGADARERSAISRRSNRERSNSDATSSTCASNSSHSSCTFECPLRDSEPRRMQRKHQPRQDTTVHPLHHHPGLWGQKERCITSSSMKDFEPMTIMERLRKSLKDNLSSEEIDVDSGAKWETRPRSFSSFSTGSSFAELWTSTTATYTASFPKAA